MISSTNPTTIEELPTEMICETFKHLSPKDLASCSQVNKRWRSIYATFKLHRLAVLEDLEDWKISQWYHSNQPLEEKELFPMAMFWSFVDKPLLSNLKHLALNKSSVRTKCDPLDLNKLNSFEQLIHLEIKCGRVVGDVTLKLPKLKVLAIYRLSQPGALSIDCPELNVLSINRFDFISKATLLSLPKLKELHYNETMRKLFGDPLFEVGTHARVRRVLLEFLDDLKMLKESDFKFTFSGFQLTKTMLDQIDFGVGVNSRGGEIVIDEYVYTRNHQLITDATLDFVHTIKYPLLVRTAPETIPSCFFKKFDRIEKVEASCTQVRDEKHFLEFLKPLSWLRCLILYDQSLSQEFYDQLPVSAPSLIQLTLFGEHSNLLQLNFDFISKLSRLRCFTTLPGCPLKSFTPLVHQKPLTELPTVEFYFYDKDGKFLILKRNAKVWRILEFGRPRPTWKTFFETQNFDEIFNYLDPRV